MSDALRFAGRCWVFGDNIPTDQIVKSNRVYLPMDVIVTHVLEDLDPSFASEVRVGDIVVAGRHFGQSSGRAIATKALRATGIGCVIADGFARTFYRNAFEIGLPILECPGVTEHVRAGDVLEADIATGSIRNVDSGATLQASPTPPFLLAMLRGGGLIPIAAELVGKGVE
jgi:3-isopropylmalate/(R)-2-methylmalate dehydratase small subunit